MAVTANTRVREQRGGTGNRTSSNSTYREQGQVLNEMDPIFLNFPSTKEGNEFTMTDILFTFF